MVIKKHGQSEFRPAVEAGIHICKLLDNIYSAIGYFSMHYLANSESYSPYDKSVLATKNILEEAALHVTSGFCFLCLFRFLYSKEKFFLWASGMMMILIIREIHPPIADVGTYVGLLWLFYIAYKKHHLFADYLRSKYLVTLLGAGFFTYVLAVTTDERILMRDLAPIPGEKEFHTKLEESLELLGHIAIGCALLFATKKTSENS